MATPIGFSCDQGEGGRSRTSWQGPGATFHLSPHEILGVEAGADQETVRAAYRRLARRLHPDARPHAPESTALFIRATEAYQTLLRDRACAPSDPHREKRPVAAPSVPSAGARPVSNPPRRPTPAPTPSPSRCGREPRTPAVGVALAKAKEHLARDDAEGAVGLLHGVLALAEGEDRQQVRRLLARAYVDVPRWRRYAVLQLRSLLEERPGDPEALALLGVAYLREGLHSRAAATLRKALHADPGQPDARRALRQIEKEERGRRPTPDHPARTERPGLLKRLLALAN